MVQQLFPHIEQNFKHLFFQKALRCQVFPYHSEQEFKVENYQVCATPGIFSEGPDLDFRGFLNFEELIRYIVN
jgi:hypothetical protein